MNPHDYVEVEFQNAKQQWRLSLKVMLQTWHWIACSWHLSDGLLCLFDLTTKIKGTARYPGSRFGELTFGGSPVIPISFIDAAFSSFAVWERKMTVSEFQERYYCAGVKPSTFLLN